MRNELTALRAAMQRAKVDAYVIPTDDFHGSEYVGDYFKCRKYISGFTGSAGTLVVTLDWAGLWTDGRYFLQAGQQLAGTGIDLMKMREPGVPALEEWLAQNLTAGQVLGFDGRCMTCASGNALEEAAEEAGAAIRYDLDLVGEIWTDRPAMSEKPAWELSTDYCGCARHAKLAALKDDLKHADADTHILTSLDDIGWLLNIRGDDVECCPFVLSYLLVTPDSLRFYVDERKFSPELRAALEADGITFCPYLELYEDVKQLPAGSTVLIDPSKLNYAILKNIPADTRIIRAQNPTVAAKAVKNETEVANERIAHIRDGAALTHFMKWLREHVGKEPMTEISVSERLEQFRAEQKDYLGPSFDPIMGYGEHGAIVHYKATPESDAALKPEGFLLSDTGGHYLQGTTDVTRTFVLGPLTDDMKFHYTVVLKSHLDLLSAVFRKGVNGAALDAYARRPLWEQGLDYNHGTGHGVGYLLNVHEGPQRIHYGAGTSAAVVPGMITSDEPGLYLEGRYGIRHESLVVCVEKETTEFGTFCCFEPLTMCPFELDAINVGQLTEEERTTLNRYHALVLRNLTPYFTGKDLEWLQLVCRAI